MKDKPRKHLSGENGFIEGVLDKKEFDPESKGNNTSSQRTAVEDGDYVPEGWIKSYVSPYSQRNFLPLDIAAMICLILLVLILFYLYKIQG